MAASAFVTALNRIQLALSPLLLGYGFKRHARTYNRQTLDGLVHVISFQLASFDPPGTTHQPGLRENLYGHFTVNLGVFVPEVCAHFGGHRKRRAVREYDCCLRARLAELEPELRRGWWPAADDAVVIDQIRERLKSTGLPFLDRFSSREKILTELAALGSNRLYSASHPSRIVLAIIWVTRGEPERARELLAEQARTTEVKGHKEYVHKLARVLGLGDLNGR